nr:immunoglobulin heavy chain junction region [Macaca mulatta]MOW25344.1 immunoglobulin heavy chain junction region [Macaca mulatta]MOW25512.1 immunoglobulin heavy chain junction region [Macaca mulatta]
CVRWNHGSFDIW